MIDLSEEIAAFESAVYGKDVRAALVSEAEEIQEQVNDAIENQLIEVDDTLSVEGAGADAKATGERILEVDCDISGLSGYPQYQYIIAANGKWTTSAGKHYSIPVSGGDSVAITGNLDYSSVCAFLKSDNAATNVTADFCSNSGGTVWNERKVISAGDTVEYTAPSDCNILYIAIKASGEQSLVPERVYINGADIGYGLRERVTELTAEVNEITKSLFDSDAPNIEKNLDIWGLRNTLDGEYSKVDLPAYSHLSDFDLPLYSNGYRYVHSIDLTKNKNLSSNKIRVRNDSELRAAISNASSGDTIILEKNNYGAVTINKSINLIGVDNPILTSYVPGNFVTTESSVVFKTQDDYEYTHTNIYDITNINKGLILPLVRATSVSTVTNVAGTYIVSNGKLYLHLFNGNRPTDENIAIVGDDANVISLSGSDAECKWYLEGLTIFGGSSCIRAHNSASYPAQTVIGVDVKTYYAQTSNNIFMRGVDAYFQRCLAVGAYLDGFNYHELAEGDVANGFEVDCVGHDNGSRQSVEAPSNNGSTMHDGGKIVRINGLYYNNNGGNVADASPNTESYNYGCTAFDSKAPYDNEDETSADYWARYASMYLYGCRALGDSQYNLRTYTTGTIYVDGVTEYDNNKTTGNIQPISG